MSENQPESTPELSRDFFSAVKRGCSHSVAELVREGQLNVNEQDAEGMTPLHHAASFGARPCVLVLIKSEKCDYLLQDNYGRYAADLASEWAQDYALARLLRKKKIFQADEQGVPAWEPPKLRQNGPAPV